jgi:uncharacterized protein (TIRG00374 family)
LGVVFWFAKDTGVTLGEAGSLIPSVHHLGALAAVGLSLLGRAARVAFLARALGYGVGLSEGVVTQLAGEAAAAATPSRTGSDPARILFLKRFGVDVPAGISILAGEIVAEGLVLGPVVLALFVLLPESNAVALGALPYAVTSLAVPFAAFLSVRHPGSRTPPRLWTLLRLSPRKWREFRVGARRFRSKARALQRLDVGTIVRVLLVSLVHVLAKLTVLPLLVLGVSPEAALGPLIAWPLLLLYTGSLLPPPGGGGAVEVTFIAALSGVIAEDSLAGILLWWRFYTFYLGALAGALVIISALGRSGLAAVGLGRRFSRAIGAELPAPERR